MESCSSGEMDKRRETTESVVSRAVDSNAV